MSAITSKILTGDCVEVMKSFEDESVDCIITDPPYGISFVNLDWDKTVPNVEVWKECLRVLKSGAFAFVMSSPRLDVQSQMAIRLQQAGFEIGFTPIYWARASSLPKGANIYKVANKRCHIQEDEAVPSRDTSQVTVSISQGVENLRGGYAGFQPKLVVEVILVAMKPLSEKTYVAQASKNGKGVTWLNDGRIPFHKGESPDDLKRDEGCIQSSIPNFMSGYRRFNYVGNQNGRFPANLLVSDDVLDGDSTSQNDTSKGSFSRHFSLDAWWSRHISERLPYLPLDAQETFPFFLVPTASLEERKVASSNIVKNTHPTVKPLALMSYLVVLGSRPNDLVLDPFAGSGTTCVAAKLAWRNSIGIEINGGYAKIAEARINKLNVGNLATWADISTPSDSIISKEEQK